MCVRRCGHLQTTEENCVRQQVKTIKKTKEMDKILKKFDAKNSILILDKNSKDKIFRATKNIPNVKCTDIGHFSAYDILKFKKIIFTETSVKELEKRYN